MIEMGIIDIDLSAFRFRKTEVLNGDNQNFFKEEKISSKGTKLEREIVSGKIHGNLRKNTLNKALDI